MHALFNPHTIRSILKFVCKNINVPFFEENIFYLVKRKSLLLMKLKSCDLEKQEILVFLLVNVYWSSNAISAIKVFASLLDF